LIFTTIAIHRLKSSRTSGKGECKTTCMQVLRLALELDVEFVEMDFEVVIPFFSNPSSLWNINYKVLLIHLSLYNCHNYDKKYTLHYFIFLISGS